VVSTSSTVIALLLGVPSAYGFARLRFAGRSSLLVGVFLTRGVPPIALVVPFYLLMRTLNLHDTRTGLTLVYVTFTLPFVIWMMRADLLGIPAELEEAAWIDGCTRYGAFWRVVLPLAVPGMVASAIFSFLLPWNEFLFAIVLSGESAKTASAAVVGFLTDKAILWGRLFAGGTLILLPALIVSVVIQRHLVRGATMGALKG
jgi:multiple sugar transport system permease protein